MHATRHAEVLQQAGMEVRVVARDFLWGVPCRSLLAQKAARS
jgi:hypothetical protein